MSHVYNDKFYSYQWCVFEEREAAFSWAISASATRNVLEKSPKMLQSHPKCCKVTQNVAKSPKMLQSHLKLSSRCQNFLLTYNYLFLSSEWNFGNKVHMYLILILILIRLGYFFWSHWISRCPIFFSMAHDKNIKEHDRLASHSSRSSQWRRRSGLIEKISDFHHSIFSWWTFFFSFLVFRKFRILCMQIQFSFFCHACKVDDCFCSKKLQKKFRATSFSTDNPF
jgi:hypothetical protein